MLHFSMFPYSILTPSIDTSKKDNFYLLVITTVCVKDRGLLSQKYLPIPQFLAFLVINKELAIDGLDPAHTLKIKARM